MSDTFNIPCVVNDDEMCSIFSSVAYEKITRGGMLLSNQIMSTNFRLRESAAGYASDWHVAGDPTLIIIQQGVLRIICHNNICKDFSVGEMFIVADYLPEGLVPDDKKYGHRAEVVGGENLRAVHIKLSGFAV